MTDGSRPTGTGEFRVVLIGVASGLLYAVVLGAQRAMQRGPMFEGAALRLQTGLYLLATLGLFALYVLLLLRCRGGAFGRAAPGSSRSASPSCSTCPWRSSHRVFRSTCSLTSRTATSSRALSGNPYVDPSSIVAHTPFGAELLSHGWRPVHPVSPYGPFWTHLETTIVQMFDGVRGQLLAFKLVLVVSSLGSALVIWGILGRVRPEFQLLGTLAFLWNPMIVVEVAGEGHNDAVMVLFVMIALLLTIQGRASSGLVAMSLGVLVKYLPLLLVPPQAVYLWRTRRNTRHFAMQVASGVAIAAMLAAALFAPLWAGADSLRGVWLSGQTGQTGSTHDVLIDGLSRSYPASAAEPLVYLLLVAGFAAFVWARAASVTDADSCSARARASPLAYMLFVSPDVLALVRSPGRCAHGPGADGRVPSAAGGGLVRVAPGRPA